MSLSEEETPLLADLMLGHYTKNSSWEGIQDWLDNEPLLEVVRRRIVLVDGEQKVVYSHSPEFRGLVTTELNLEGGIPIEKDGLHVGTVYDVNRFTSGGTLPRLSPESFFLRNVNQATGIAALIAALLALVLGILTFARAYPSTARVDLRHRSDVCRPLGKAGQRLFPG